MAGSASSVTVHAVFVWIVECAQWSHPFVGSVWSTFEGAVEWIASNGGCDQCTVTMAELDNPSSID